jgi:outer membrane immunogenic protein
MRPNNEAAFGFCCHADTRVYGTPKHSWKGRKVPGTIDVLTELGAQLGTQKREVGMRRVLLTTISLLALSAAPSLAADLPRSMPAKAPVMVPVYNWTGFYLGINGGYGWGRSDWTAFGLDTDPSGGLIGGTIGYNWQGVGSPFVFGLEGDIAWSGIKGDATTVTCPTGCETRNTWLGTARGRLGYAFDRWMPYVTGGVAFGEIEATQGGLPSTKDTQAGWTAGGGVEAVIVGNWTAKLEYLYVDLGNIGCGVGSCVPATDVDFRSHVVRAGLNFRF